MYLWVCVSVSNGALPAAGQGLWTSGAPMSKCWDLGKLGSRGQVLPKVSYWTDTPGTNIHMYISIYVCTYIYIYEWKCYSIYLGIRIYCSNLSGNTYLLLMDLPPHQGKRWDCWGCLCLCQCWLACLCWSGCPVVYICVLYMCFCVCLMGIHAQLGRVELWQAHLYQVTEFHMLTQSQ